MKVLTLLKAMGINENERVLGGGNAVTRFIFKNGHFLYNVKNGLE